jgi:hypothetical protein
METALICHGLLFLLLFLTGTLSDKIMPLMVIINRIWAKNAPLSGTCANPFELTDWFFSEKSLTLCKKTALPFGADYTSRCLC